MDALETPRLRLVALALDEAAAMLDGLRPDRDRWTPGYPTGSNLVAAGYVVTAAAQGYDLGPWTVYQLVRKQDGRVVGGLGFFGPPDDAGDVDVGFSEPPELRAEGYAAEGLRALIAYAKAQPEVRRVLADTAVTNRRVNTVLAAAGMRRSGSDGRLVFYEA